MAPGSPKWHLWGPEWQLLEVNTRDAGGQTIPSPLTFTALRSPIRAGTGSSHLTGTSSRGKMETGVPSLPGRDVVHWRGGSCQVGTGEGITNKNQSHHISQGCTHVSS